MSALAHTQPAGLRAPPRRPRLQVGAVDGLSALAPAAWDTLHRPGSGPLRHGYLSAWERAELAGLQSRPIVATTPDRATPLAAAPGYLYDLDLASVEMRVLPRAVAAVRRWWPRFLVARTYELGSPTALTDPFLHDPSLDCGSAVRALARIALDEASDRGVHLTIVQDFAGESGPAAEALRELSFEPVPIPPTVVLDLPFDSFEDYLGAMRASYRRRARQALSRAGHLHVEHTAEFAPVADELARLWRLVYERAEGIQREVLPAAYFRAVAALDDVSVLLLRRADGSIASYALLMADRPWLHFLYCGFEADAGRQEGAYFRMLYEIARVAIEGGFVHVNLGSTTCEPKQDLGGVVVPLTAWMHHSNPVLQRGFKALARGPFAPPAIPPRRVFKDAPAPG